MVGSDIRVFVSHSSRDSGFVEWLLRELRSAGIEIWYARWEIKVGDSIIAKINEGLQTSDRLLVILSRASVQSRWVAEELNAATMRRIQNRGAFILPVLVEDCEIPPLLSHLKYADFRTDRERGIRDLRNALLPPSQLLQERLEEISRRVKDMFRTISDVHSAHGVLHTVARLYMYMDSAVDNRYEWERRKRGHLPDHKLDFFGRLSYLSECGLDLRSPSWAVLRSLRNHIHHSSQPTDPEIAALLKELRADIKELQSICDRLCELEGTGKRK
jgi:hypothetical protein